MKISDSLIHFSSRHASQNSDQFEQTRTEEQVVRKDRTQSPSGTAPDQNTILVDRVNISVQATREYESQYSALQSSRSTVTDSAGETLGEFNQKKTRDKLPDMDPQNRYKIGPSWKSAAKVQQNESDNLGQIGNGPVLKRGSVLNGGELEHLESTPLGTGTLVKGLVGGITGIEMTDVSLRIGTPVPVGFIGSATRLGQSLDRSDFVSWSPDQGQPAETLVTINTNRIHHETEQLEISSTGTVTTQDGRSIDFAMEIAMNREFLSKEQQETITHTFQQELIDPLTISLDGSVTQLSDARFEFDLDNDGDTEQISFVSKGSGFLSFDLNGDGIINNGSELFGPGTGNGFGELGEYDIDKNGWIDESDTVFEKLSVWTRDDQGNDRLISLKDAGVGAIYLDNARVDFEMKGADNELKGKLRRSGVFLFENGNVGSIQQIDLADRSGATRLLEGTNRYITEV